MRIDYHYVHKSVRGYHAASYIKRRPETFAIKFYSAMLHEKLREWKQELNFLSQMDEYRFVKYFLVPIMELTFEEVGFIR